MPGIHRIYNKWVRDENLEDYALRYMPKNFRKWSGFTIANTAIGGISFLALEAIGASIALSFGYTTAIYSILCAAVIMFLLGIPISIACAKHNISIDLLSRTCGFGYSGSTITSLVNASFCFIFFALEAVIMAQALEIAFNIPLVWGYVISSLVIIPMAVYGMKFISKFQLYTQPIWLVLMIVPYFFVFHKEPQIIQTFISLSGAESGTSNFSLLHFGLATGVSLSLISQIGEQANYLRFMPDLTRENRLKWWFYVIFSGPGWIILGFLKQIGGVFFASLIILTGYGIASANEPVHMYIVAYQYVFDNPQLILIISAVFVIISQVKINVTNAYAGSLAWSNFFTRIAYNHVGRVIWVVFNIAIAVLLMVFGVFDAIENVLGIYSVIAISWIGVMVADLSINKKFGLSPGVIEYKRAHLYGVNPVGVISLTVASIVSMLAFTGFLGEYPRAFSSFLALLISFTATPLIAYLTKGKYYILRENDIHHKTQECNLAVCSCCSDQFDYSDMVYCPVYEGDICSLCCSLNSTCKDQCKTDTEPDLWIKLSEYLHKLTRFPTELIRQILFFLLIYLGLCIATGFLLWIVYFLQNEFFPADAYDVIRNLFKNIYVLFISFLAPVSLIILFIIRSNERAEEEIHEKNHDLSTEIEIRKEAEMRAEAATKAKSDFLANMSHEIRTPMNAVIGLSHLIQKTDLSGKQKDYIRKISASANNLLGIINDILDFSKIEAGKLSMEIIDFNLNDVFDNLAGMIGNKARDKGLEFIFDIATDIPPNLQGDPLRLGQVLLNLTNNAVKFTDNGEIAVSVEEKNKDDKKITLKFKVRDTGIGLNEDQRGKLFQAFSQADTSTTRKFGGTGLGLSISKKLVELMGGTIGVESELGNGSTFYFTAIFDYLSDKKRENLPEEIRNLDVLIVDDNSTSREVLKAYCRDFAFDSTTVENGSEAISLIKKMKNEGSNIFDLILMDYTMPELNGFETAAQINEFLLPDERPKYILVTSYGRDEILDNVDDAGFSGFILKPINQSLLFNTIVGAFGFGNESVVQRSGKVYPDNFDKVRGASILLVEDNEINQQVARELLESEGFKIDIAENGQIAVDKVFTNFYNIVLMDLQMPVMGGYDATRKIREYNSDIPIVAMTADAMTGVRSEVIQSGMNDYITKPIDPMELFSVLVRFIDPETVSEKVSMSELKTTPQTGENSNVSDFSGIPQIDAETGMKRVGGNYNLYNKLLKSFYTNNKDFLSNLRSLLEEGSIKEAEALTHTLKGVSGNIGANSLFNKITELDNILRQDNPDSSELERLIRTTEEQLEELLGSLSIYIQKKEAEEENNIGKILGSRELEEALLNLKTALETYDTSSSELLDICAPSLIQGDLKESYMNLNKAIAEYDFENALNQLADMMENL